MNPIPTTNAMKPAPGKGVSSFPTPVIKDTVIVEVVNAWKGDYTPLEYGARWDDYPHASVQGSFPDHKLISQAPTSEDGQWVKRIWANDRVDQDTYNYAIKYSGGSDAHPIYIRTYLEPRDTYAPVLDGTADPLFPGAFLVDEEVTRTEGEFDSRYVQVTRVYETLPGPVVPTRRINERGDLETVNTQTVAPGTQPDPDGLLVTQSQVVQEEVSKGVKTTATVPSHSVLAGRETKSGLLGSTQATDSIVDPSTPVDALTFNGSSGIIESSVTPISATKSKKVTVTSGGPVQLSSQSLVDSPLGLVNANVEKSIVVPSTQPSGNLQTIRDDIERLDSAKSQRERVQVQGNWPKNTGVDYDEQLGIGIYYEETIVPPSEYLDPVSWQDLSNTDYKPIDQWKSLRRITDKERIAEGLLSQWYKITTDVNISLPDKLLGANIYWGISFGEGQDVDFDEGVTTGSFSLSQSSSSKSSASVNGDIYFNIQQGFNGSLPGYQHIFFMEIGADGRVEQNDILNILNNFEQFGQRTPPPSEFISLQQKYKRWPYIQTRSENVVVISGGKSEQKNKSRSEYASINGFGAKTGTGSSFDVDVNARSINIPQTLHGTIPIIAVTIGNPPPNDLLPTYQVQPPSLQPTKAVINGVLQDAPSFPTGNYLYSSNVELYKWGFVKVTATTVEITAGYT
jgi:hypothetical protein